MKLLITGSAGFIGFHLIETLIRSGHDIVGIDNINNYYSQDLKYARLEQSGIDRNLIVDNSEVISKKYPNYTFIKMDITDAVALDMLFAKFRFDIVCNLAAQAGVRYSIKNPHSYIDSNIYGFINVLECCRNYNVHDLIYASSSSVYGLNEKQPFSVDDNVDRPISLYAATKKSNELMAYCYSHLYGFSTIGLRFFTVYGPWGRPDMAPMLFADAISNGLPIKVFNEGNLERDFTYIDDIIAGVIKIIDSNYLDGTANMPLYRLYNIGNNKPVKLMNFIQAIELNLGKDAVKEFLPMQLGDVYSTYADIDPLVKDYGYYPETDINVGIKKFIEWFNEFYKS